MPYCSECGEEVEEGTNFCPECGSPILGSKSARGVTINRNVINSYVPIFGWFLMLIAVFLPWMGGYKIFGLLEAEQLSFLHAPVTLLVFSWIFLFIGVYGQIQTTVGKVPLITKTAPGPTKLRYLAPLGILLGFIGFIWFISTLSNFLGGHISPIRYIDSGFWLFILGFLIVFAGYGSLIKR